MFTLISMKNTASHLKLSWTDGRVVSMTKEFNKRRKKIIEKVSIQLDRCTNYAGCRNPSPNDDPDKACGNCPVYAELRKYGKQLETLKGKKTNGGVTNKYDINTYTEEEDQIIIEHFQQFGRYHGCNKDIAEKLGRKPNSTHARINVLIKNKILVLEEVSHDNK